MNENKKTILTDIIGIVDINSASGRNRLIYDFNDIDVGFQEYIEFFKDDPVILKDMPGNPLPSAYGIPVCVIHSGNLVYIQSPDKIFHIPE